MITSYNIFRANESINLKSDVIIDIIRSLESEDNKNSSLINKLANHTNTDGKSVLMEIVQEDDEELVDYVLKFNPDIHKVTKNGDNVLSFCKSAKMFYKFYNLGVDINVKNKNGDNILLQLANKKIFNVDLYQRLINDGIDINEVNVKQYGSYSAFGASILNLKMIDLFIENGVNLNREDVQKDIFNTLIRRFQYYEKDRKKVSNIFKKLFENGMKIQNVIDFSNIVEDLRWIKVHDGIIEFLKTIKEYLDESTIREIWNKESLNVDYTEKLLNLGVYPNFYKFLRRYYRYSDIKPSFLDEYLKKHPYIAGMEKFNI